LMWLSTWSWKCFLHRGAPLRGFPWMLFVSILKIVE
jgi:hypothetical protein